MKASTILFLLIVLAGIASNSQAKTIDHAHYKIQAPNGWVKLSNERIEALQRKNPATPKAYTIGYISDSLDKDATFFIANYNEIPGIEDALFRDIILQQTEILKKSNIPINITVDSTQYKFYNEFELNDKYVYYGFSLGGKGILYLQFFTSTTNQGSVKKVFLTTLNSIKHETNFSNRNAHNEKAKEHLEKSGEYAFYTIIGLVIFLLSFWMRKQIKK